MTSKIKLIICAIIALAVIVSIISVFVYINNLNNKVTDLNVTLADQRNEIQALNCKIESIEKNVESFRETISITNNYIENIEKVHREEITTKQEVYETIVKDQTAKDWYNEPLPNSLVGIIMNETSDLVCSD